LTSAAALSNEWGPLGSPARKAQRGDSHLVAERAEHRVRERAFVPRAVVAAAVDEERRREVHAARLCALDVAGDACLRGVTVGGSRVGIFDAELLGDGAEVVLGELFRAL